MEFAAQSHSKVLFLHAVGGKFCLIIVGVSYDKSCSLAGYLTLYTLYRKMFKSKKFDLKNDRPKNPYFCLQPLPGKSNRPEI